MHPISGSTSGAAAAATQHAQAPRPPAVDADGDNDGTKAATPPTSKPTATVGNNVDLHA